MRAPCPTNTAQMDIKKYVEHYEHLERKLMNLIQKIEHAGFLRYILDKNPRRFNEYGDELDDSESDPEADADAEDENPYGEIRLEGRFVVPVWRSLLTPLRTVTAPGTSRRTCEPPNAKPTIFRQCHT